MKTKNIFGPIKNTARKAGGLAQIYEAIEGLKNSSRTYVPDDQTHYAFLRPSFEFKFVRSSDEVIVSSYVEGYELICYGWSGNSELFLREYLHTEDASRLYGIEEGYNIVSTIREVKHFGCPSCHKQHPLIRKREPQAHHHRSKRAYKLTYFVICLKSKRIEMLYVPEKWTEPDHTGLG